MVMTAAAEDQGRLYVSQLLELCLRVLEVPEALHLICTNLKAQWLWQHGVLI